jgi:hypothetical protein
MVVQKLTLQSSGKIFMAVEDSTEGPESESIAHWTVVVIAAMKHGRFLDRISNPVNRGIAMDRN